MICTPRKSPETAQEYLETYPRIVAHLICESLGYATPSTAARILKDATEGRRNYCEWIFTCYDCDPMKPVQLAIKRRHTHHGYMADYKLARALVDQAIRTGEEPLLASWF